MKLLFSFGQLFFLLITLIVFNSSNVSAQSNDCSAAGGSCVGPNVLCPSGTQGDASQQCNDQFGGPAANGLPPVCCVPIETGQGCQVAVGGSVGILDGTCAYQSSCADSSAASPECDPGTICCYQTPEEEEEAAAETQREASRQANIGGLVPCGDGSYQDRCRMCHLIGLSSNIALTLRNWMVIVGTLIITIAGVMYIVSAGNPAMTSMAKAAIKNTLIGVIVVLSAWVVVTWIMSSIALDPENFETSTDVQDVTGRDPNGNVITQGGWLNRTFICPE